METAYDKLRSALHEVGATRIAVAEVNDRVEHEVWASPHVIVVRYRDTGGFELYTPRPAQETVPETLHLVRELAGWEPTPHSTRPVDEED